jgi:hypothetical protein
LEPIDAGREGDEVEDLKMKSRARTAAAARHAFRKVHIVFARACEARLTTGRAARSGFEGSRRRETWAIEVDSQCVYGRSSDEQYITADGGRQLGILEMTGCRIGKVVENVRRDEVATLQATDSRSLTSNFEHVMSTRKKGRVLRSLVESHGSGVSFWEQERLSFVSK